MRYLISIIVVLVFTQACTKKKNADVEMQIGQFEITKKYSEYRNRVIKVYYPQESRSLGKDQLMKAYITAQILINNGYPINDSVLNQEADRIDKSTLMPEMLNQIKAIFGDDREAYLKVFILPTLAERVIFYDFFLKDKKIQSKSLKTAEDFIGEAKKDPKKFSELAKAKKYGVGKLRVSKALGLDWVREDEDEARKGPDQSKVPMQVQEKLQDDQQAQESAEGRKWVDEIVTPLKPGDVYGQVIDRNENWMVVRYLGPKKDDPKVHELEAATLPKEDFAKWMEEEKDKIEIVEN